MAHVQYVDELVREYLLFRGFASSVKSFDADLKADKDKGFRVDKIIDHILQSINSHDLNGLKDMWSHMDSSIFSKLESHFVPAVKKIESGLLKYYLVTAYSAGKTDKVNEFLTKISPDAHGYTEWRDWFMLLYIQKPEDNPIFSVYFTRQWQDTLIVSLHNFLAIIFQCMPQPTLSSYESETAIIKRLQEENASLKLKLANMTADKAQGAGHQSRYTQHVDRIKAPSPIIDDFYTIPSESVDGGVREARGLRDLIRQMGGSPVSGRKQSRSLSQN